MRRLSRAVLLSFVLTSSAALAEPTPADRATARTLAQEGQTALESKNYAIAIDRFSRADSLVHAPTLLLGLARSQVALGKLVEAQESYNRIIRDGVAATSPHSWAKALEDANREVAALPARIPWVTITVLGPTNPEVIIDSTPVPAASLGVKRPVNPGNHTVRVSAEGFVPGEKSITLADGQSLTVNLELEQTPSDPSQVSKKATVGGDTGSSSDGDTRKYVAYGALGLGGAGLIVGAVTGAIAIHKNSQLKDLCTGSICDPMYAPQRDSYHAMTSISTVAFIVGGVGTAAGVVLLLTQPTRPPQAAKGAHITPFIGVGSVGVTGAF